MNTIIDNDDVEIGNSSIHDDNQDVDIGSPSSTEVKEDITGPTSFRNENDFFLQDPLEVTSTMISQKVEVKNNDTPSDSGSLQPPDTTSDVPLPMTSLSSQRNISIPGAFIVQGTNARNNDDNNVEEDTEDIHGGEVEGQVQDADRLPSSLVELVSAYTVPEEPELVRTELEQEIRSQVYQEAVQAIAVVSRPSEEEDDCSNDSNPRIDETTRKETTKTIIVNINRRSSKLALIWLIVLVVLAVTLGITLGANKQEPNINIQPTGVNNTRATIPFDETRSTVEIIRDRGSVRCGMYDIHVGFSVINPSTGKRGGIAVTHCQALALAILGDMNKIEIVIVDFTNHLHSIKNHSIDVLTPMIPTIQKDIWDPITEYSYTFSKPFFYTGLSFAGRPDFVTCANHLDMFQNQCRQLSVCITFGTRFQTIVQEVMPGVTMTNFYTKPDLIAFLNNGTCNVVANEPSSISEAYLRQLGYEGDYARGTSLLNREPMSMVSRDNDPEFSNYINLIVDAFVMAEANNITKSNAGEFRKFIGNDADLAATVVSLVSTFGNYKNVYSEIISSHLRVNEIYNFRDPNNTAGLLYSFSFDHTAFPDPDFLSDNGKFSRIIKRGYLRCGVKRRSMFAEAALDTSQQQQHQEIVWSGFDVEFCRAIAAALFQNSKGNVEFIELASPQHNYVTLLNQDVDVVAGAKVTVQADYLEPSTNIGFTFSAPYFYDNNEGNAYSMMTGEDDNQWSDFVNSIVMAIVYADEAGINRNSSVKMPVIDSLGGKWQQAFRDCIADVGSYSEIYNRTLQSRIPRSGANLLGSSEGPLHFPIPFS